MSALFPVLATRSTPSESLMFPPANSRVALARVKVALPAPAVLVNLITSSALVVYTAAPCLKVVPLRVMRLVLALPILVAAAPTVLLSPISTMEIFALPV